MHGTSSVLKLAVNLNRDIIRTLGSWGFSHKEGTDSVKPLLIEICLKYCNSTRYLRAIVFESRTMKEVPVTTRVAGVP